MRIYMEIVFFCLPTNDMLIIFYINFYENSSFNEKKKSLLLDESILWVLKKWGTNTHLFPEKYQED